MGIIDRWNAECEFFCKSPNYLAIDAVFLVQFGGFQPLCCRVSANIRVSLNGLSDVARPGSFHYYPGVWFGRFPNPMLIYRKKHDLTTSEKTATILLGVNIRNVLKRGVSKIPGY